MKLGYRVAVLLSASLLLAGCESLGTGEAAPVVGLGGVATAGALAGEPLPAGAAGAAAAPGEAALLQFVAEEGPGAQAVLDDGRGGILVAMVERQYVSARGRSCKRLSLQRGAAGGTERRLACRAEAGWQLVQPLTGGATL